jgi:hypothetical protein
VAPSPEAVSRACGRGWWRLTLREVGSRSTAVMHIERGGSRLTVVACSEGGGVRVEVSGGGARESVGSKNC